MDKELKIILTINFAIFIGILLFADKNSGGFNLLQQVAVNFFLVFLGLLVDVILKTHTARAFLLSFGLFSLLSFGACQGYFTVRIAG